MSGSIVQQCLPGLVVQVWVSTNAEEKSQGLDPGIRGSGVANSVDETPAL